jgi:ATP-dependent Clp protease ATP-binding subunit ClpA
VTSSSRKDTIRSTGARPLKRTIQRRILDPLALAVLQGEFGEGDLISIDAGAHGLTMRGTRPRLQKRARRMDSE